MRALSTLVVALTLAGCSSSTAPANRIDGDYELDAVNGKPLPTFTMAFEGGSYYLAGLRLRLSASGQPTPYYVAFRRDSVVYPDGKPTVMASTFGGDMVIENANTFGLANFPGMMSDGAVADGAFTVLTTTGSMHFRRVR